MWGKKQKHCDENDPADADFGDCWDFVVFDSESKLVVSLVLGARTAETAEQTFADFYFRTDGVPPRLITTDEFNAYESVILSLIGGGLGIALGVYLGGVILSSLMDIFMTPTTLGVILGFGISTGVGLFFGIYPAMKAARMDPIEALSYE